MIVILNEHMDKITTEKSNTPADYLTIRCPQCLKLYMVQEEQIKTVFPEFTCTGCRCHFAFEYPVPNRDSVVTFQIAPTQFEFKKKCPKCDHMQNEKNEICSACGVVIENYLLIKNETYPKVSVDLIKLWNDVLQEFENGYTHELFIKNCQSKNKLDYAEFKYKELGKRAGDETMVMPWLEKINPAKYDPNYKEKLVDEQISKLATEKEQEPLPKSVQKIYAFYAYMVKHNWFYLIGTLAGILLIVMGISTPGKRNQIGLGIALLLSSLGFYIFRSNPHQKK
jgi:hypothetical protein